MGRLWIFCFAAIALISSCHRENSSLIRRTITLKKNLGTVSIDLPKDFDTFFNSQLSSDNECSDRVSYTWQPKKYAIDTIQYDFSTKQVDSARSFSISHLRIPECGSKRPFEPVTYLVEQKRKIIEIDYRTRLQIQETRTINGQVYVVFAEGDVVNNVYQNTLWAVTKFNGALLTFNFARLSPHKYPGDFNKETYDMLKTIKLAK